MLRLIATTFDIFGRHRLLRNVRQTPVGLPLGISSPEPHQIVQLFPALSHRDFRRPKRQLAGFRKGSFPGQIKVGDIPSFIQPARDFQRCVKRLDNRLAQLEHLFIRHDANRTRSCARAAKSSTAPVTRSFASSNRAAATRLRSGI